jgi:hypothetical protein
MPAIWKGYLKCSPMSVPVRPYSAPSQHPWQFHCYSRQGNFSRHRSSLSSLPRPGLHPERRAWPVRGFKRLGKNPT